MAINEQIVTGRKFRKLIDEASKLWQRVSFWNMAEDTEFNDGKNAETKLGAIDGITDSMVSTSSNIAASAKALSTLNNNLGGYSFGETADGKPGFRKPGADTVTPFRSAPTLAYLGTYEGTSRAITYGCANIPGYKDFTVNNFVFKNVRAKANSQSEYNGVQTGNPVGLSYNNATGILSVSGGIAGTVIYTMATVIADIYVVY